MTRYAITAGTGRGVLDQVRGAAEAGADLVQIREPGLPIRELLAVCQAARAAVGGRSCRILVNRRWDIARAAGLDGVHLPAAGLPGREIRRRVPAGFLIGQSCHTAAEVEQAAPWADFCVFGPVFETPGKGPAVGLDGLRGVTRLGVPVLALGGISAERVADCVRAGAAGVAGIRMWNLAPRIPVE